MTPAKLTAGPEGDARIAEAMGLYEDESGNWWDGGPDPVSFGKPPAYTTTWDGLGAMVEWIEAQEWGLVQARELVGNSNANATVRVHDKSAPYISRDYFKQSNHPKYAPMLAVGEALLAAVAEEDPARDIGFCRECGEPCECLADGLGGFCKACAAREQKINNA